MLKAHDVLNFWFREIDKKLWFQSGPEFDALIRERFAGTWTAASEGKTVAWRDDGKGRLAEILVLDQFSRNLFRRDPRAFSQDARALALAEEAIELRVDADMKPEEKSFLYMPFMHSESPAAHDRAMELFAQPGLEENFKFEKAHKAIIDRFGRYPHRNQALGRASTKEEIEFLKQPGSSF